MPWTSLTAAAVAAGLSGTLIVFMDWVPTPLNRNIRGMSVRERLPSSLVHGGACALTTLAGIVGWRWIVGGMALWFSIVLGVAAVNWWVPYLLGKHRGEITPAVFRDHYAANVSVLPRIGRHLVVPDLQHLLIHLSLLATAAASWRVLLVGQ